jgi:hypothetical protein
VRLCAISAFGETQLDLTQLKDHYDRLWTKAERLVEAFLDQQLAAIETLPAPPAATASPTDGPKSSRPRRAKSRSAASAPDSPKAPFENGGNISHSPTPPLAHSPIPVPPAPVPSAPAPTAMREIYIAVQCLKRILEGRHAVQNGGSNDLQSLGPTDHAKTIAEEISRRIRALCEPGRPNGDDEDSV